MVTSRDYSFLNLQARIAASDRMRREIERRPVSGYANGGANPGLLSRRLLSLGPDERLVYHRGPSFETCPLLVKSAARVALEAGQVRLFQRRVEPGLIEWLAVGRHP